MIDSTLTQIKHERDRNYASALYHKRKRVAAEAREAALLDRLAALEAERAAGRDGLERIAYDAFNDARDSNASTSEALRACVAAILGGDRR